MRPLLTIAIVVAISIPLIIYFDEIHDWITNAPTTVSGAIREGELEILKELLAKNPTVLKQADSRGDTLLHDAARHDQPKIMRFLLSKGLDPAARNGFNMTPLHSAAQWSSPGSAKLLLKNDPTIIDVADNLDRTALHIAAGDFEYRPLDAGRIAVAKILIESNANIHARDSHGRTPLQCAAKTGSAELVEWLIKAGANPSVREDDGHRQPDQPLGNSALQIAAQFGNHEVVKVLLEHGAPVIYLQYPEQELYESALHSACDPYLVRYRDDSGELPDDLPLTRELKTIDLLMARVGDPNIFATPRYGPKNSLMGVANHPRISRHLIENYPTMIGSAAKRHGEMWQDAPPNTPPTIANLAYKPPSDGFDAAGYVTGTIQDKTRRPARYRVEIDFDGDHNPEASGRFPADNWGFSYQLQFIAGPHELWLRLLEDSTLDEEPLASEWKHFRFTVIPAPNRPPWRCAFAYQEEGGSLDIIGGISDLTGRNSEYRVEIDADGDGQSDRSLTPYAFVRPWTIWHPDWQVRKSFKTSIAAPHGPKAVRIHVIELRKGKPLATTDWINGKKASYDIEMPDLSQPVAAPQPN